MSFEGFRGHKPNDPNGPHATLRLQPQRPVPEAIVSPSSSEVRPVKNTDPAEAGITIGGIVYISRGETADQERPVTPSSDYHSAREVTPEEAHMLFGAGAERTGLEASEPPSGGNAEVQRTAPEQPHRLVETERNKDAELRGDDSHLRPSENRVAADLRSGGTVWLEVAKEGPEQPHRFEGSESAFPPSATTRAVTGATAEDAPASGQSEGNSGRWTWARLVGKRHTPTPQEAENPPEQTSAGMQLSALPDEPSGVKFRYQVTGITPEEAGQETAGNLELDIHQARRAGKDGEVRRLQTLQQEIRQGTESGLGVRSAAVATGDPAALEGVAPAVANSVFPSGEGITWEAVRDPRTGQVVHYPSKSHALAAEQGGLTDHVTARQAVGDIRYPGSGSEVSGLPAKPKYEFPVNQIVPEGASSVRLGSIIGNKGERAGSLVMTEGESRAHKIVNGASGTGKTTLARLSAIRERVADVARGGELPGILIGDFGKFGNYAQQIADGLVAAGVKGEAAVVHHIDVGAPNSVPVNLDPFDLPGMAPVESVKAAVDTLAHRIPGAEAQEVFSTWVTGGADLAHTQLGTNMKTGKSMFPYGERLSPTGDHLKMTTEEVVQARLGKTEFSSDVQGWSEAKIANAVRGAAGQLIGGDGHPLNYAALRGRILSADFGRLGDQNGRLVASALLFRGVGAQLKSEAPNGDLDGIVRQRIRLDEAYRLFPNSPLGADNAGQYKDIRGYGGVMELYGQGGLADLHTDVIDNTNVKVFFLTNNPDDQRRAGELAPPEYREATAGYIATIPDREEGELPHGRGLYIGLTTPYGPLRFKFDGPESLGVVRGSGEVRDATELLRPGRFRRIYESESVISDAKDYLLNNPNGRRLRMMAGQDVANILTGFDPGDKKGDFLDAMVKMRDEKPDVLDCAVDLAVDEAARSRVEGQWVAPFSEYRNYARTYIDAQIKGVELPERWPLSKVVDAGYYNRALVAVRTQMLAGRHEDTAQYEAALGEKIAGKYAEEQSDFVRGKENQSYQMFTRSVTTAASRGQIRDSEMSEAVRELTKLAGGGSVQDVYQRMQAKLGRDLNDRESEVFVQVARKAAESQAAQPADSDLASGAYESLPIDDDTASIWQDLDVVASGIGYPTVRRVLEEKMASHEANAPAVPAAVLKAEYGEDFPEFEKAHEQEAYLQWLQEKKNERSEQTTTNGEKLTLGHLYVAPDRMEGGLAIINDLRWFTDFTVPQHPLAAATEIALNDGRKPDHSYPQLLVDGDNDRAGRFSGLLASGLLMSSDYVLPPAVSRSLVYEHAAGINASNEIVDQKREAENAKK